MKRIRKILPTIFLILSLGLSGCKSMEVTGAAFEDEHMLKYANEANFNREKLIFKNENPSTQSEFERNVSRGRGFQMLFRFFFAKDNSSPNAIPKKKLPEVPFNSEKFISQDSKLKAVWFGHSTILLNIESKVVLIDPVFSDYASPIPNYAKRFQKPLIKVNELPKIDYVLISHDHYDHLDMNTIKKLKDRDLVFVVPLGVSEHLKKWGVSEDKIVERGWWGSVSFGDIKFTATPAHHRSGRYFSNLSKTLWASWVIEGAEKRVFFSGDSGYESHFSRIGEKFGPFDLAFVESGQYNIRWKQNHLFPEESIKASKDLNAKIFFPIHWGAFKLSEHDWNEPPKKIYENYAVYDIELVISKIGEVVDFTKKYPMDQWWVEDREVAKN